MRELKELTPEEQKERKETLSHWYYPPEQLFTMTCSGIMVPIDNTFEARASFRETDLHVDGANPRIKH